TMFSGIITAVAPVTHQRNKKDFCITIKTPKGWKLKKGDSIAVDGVCLTVADKTASTFSCHLMDETLAKTTFGRHMPSRVNLERSLMVSDRLDGHVVSGHVDAVGRIQAIDMQKGNVLLTCSFPKRFASLVVQKGSIAVDGISLTIVDCGHDWFTVSLVRYTLEHTTLQEKNMSDSLNLEFDMMGKYLVRYTQLYAQ
ncbi:riboflavin synthase, partial [Candidatus Uhrbacteria bacterium]|nr:riboflavin synthase [Candidatus Uhrbacteria bacterium]